MERQKLGGSGLGGGRVAESSRGDGKGKEAEENKGN